MDEHSPSSDLDEAALSPADYEHFCAEILRSAGWTVRVCGGTGDQGVDLVADLKGVRAVFQCKFYSNAVGNGAVQEVYTGRVFHNAQIAVVVSPAGFTPSARAAAEQTDVCLLHHSQLLEWGQGGAPHLHSSLPPEELSGATLPRDSEDLIVLAREVRRAIEFLCDQQDPVIQDIEKFVQSNGAPTKFQFPHNWCDFTSCVLAGYIARDLCENTPVYVVRASRNDSGWQHWWVRCREIDIDVTCDQFDGAPGAIIVETKSAWHEERFEDVSAVELCRRPLMKLAFELLVKTLEVRIESLPNEGRAHRRL